MSDEKKVKFPPLVPRLNEFAKQNLNVLLCGTHGAGKTSEVLRVCEEEGIKLLYFSGATMDPYVNFVGIPVPDVGAPDKEGNILLKFAKMQDMREAEMIFIDEINRADKAVQNGVLEITQFQTVNGERLPKLRMVWAAMNPDNGEYNVEKMCPALHDRFKCFVKIKPSVSVEFLTIKLKPFENENFPSSDDIAESLNEWYEELTDVEKAVITPRRLEYIGEVYMKTGFLDAIDSDWQIQDKRLKELLKATRDVLIRTPEEFFKNFELAKTQLKDSMNATKFISIFEKMDEKQLADPRAQEAIASLPKEHLIKFFNDRTPKAEQPSGEQIPDTTFVDAFKKGVTKPEYVKLFSNLEWDGWDLTWKFKEKKATK